MPSSPWPKVPVNRSQFQKPPREYGILPFWFLNGELDPEEMRYQLREFRDKGMPGIILHGRYGLEMPYVGSKYLERIQFAIEEAQKLGLKTWIYDEMNWPSGTADKRVLAARPDLAQRYLECINFTVRGPWFTYLTGADSRYNDFERSTPVAAFAVGSEGQVIDLTPNLSFTDVIPWEAPAGHWRLMYIVEKLADYYIDALNPESTAEFLRRGYDPYVPAAGNKLAKDMLGFYTDEPAMHYYTTGQDNPIVPWTKDMFRRFQERNGYNLRPRLPDLFFDISPDSARVRYDFYNTLTAFYSDAYYRQIHEWCQAHNVFFTGHLLYEEWLRKLIRVEGNVFKHYPHMDVIGVDHLYPIIGNRDRCDEHVAMKVGSSAAHQLGSPRLLCESFGGIFMDATMQRMKWVADWEYVLGVNLLNPHGYHYTFEGPRKRDWPPSMFYQFPWWRYYQGFSDYMSRLSHLLSGGKHIAKVAMIWPINAMFATYTPQGHNALGDRTEGDFNALTDLLLRLHYDYDYLDEDVLASADLVGNSVRVRDEAYELIILPPMAHIKLSTLERLEQFVASGGKVLGTVFLPNQAFGPDGLVDISARIEALFGVNPAESQAQFQQQSGAEITSCAHENEGKTAFLRTYAIARKLPLRLQQELGKVGQVDHPGFVIDSDDNTSRYYFQNGDGQRQEITTEVAFERQGIANVVGAAVAGLITPDVVIDNPEIFYLHRQNDGQDLYFLINSTRSPRTAQVTLQGAIQPVLWNPSTGEEQIITPSQVVADNTRFEITLPPVGSAFVLPMPAPEVRVVESDIQVEAVEGERIRGYGRVSQATLTIEQAGQQIQLNAQGEEPSAPLTLDGEWQFACQGENALVLGKWWATQEIPGKPLQAYTAPEVDLSGWLPMVPGAWSYQLPAEPSTPYPLNVWYRIPFQAEYTPNKLSLIEDGFAGSGWKLFVNGQPVTAKPVRSAFDAQMQAVDITNLIHPGDNVIALRLTVTGTTDGLIDLLKLTGDFSLTRQDDGGYRIAAPRASLQPASWTEQGYPFFSGIGIYRRSFTLPADYAGQRIVLEPEMADDVLEVVVNGQTAGVRLWAPYSVDVTGLLQPGENSIELRVANTAVNLLEATERPSGLAGGPQLVPYRQFTFEF